jgi:glyceraldehyde-3-phosphate dehydrogenase (NAD(P))
MALLAFKKHERIRIVSLAQGFLGNASLFRYARDLGNLRGDMYEVGLWEDSVVESGPDVMYAINIPQEAVTIPETIDAIRAAFKLQPDSATATSQTNTYLGLGKWLKR